MLGGKVRVAEWKDGQEPMLQVDKRGRFITNMGFANVVTAAVDSDDPRIKGSCMVILEETDPGTFDRGTPTKKLVHQLSLHPRPGVQPARARPAASSAATPSRTASSSRAIRHGEIIEAVFRRTRVTVGLMTSAKLLSAVEPVILYQRRRFRGGEGAPGTPRYELGLQQKEDVLHRLVDIWATGEASASLGFAAARLFDELDPLEKQKDEIFAAQNLTGRAAFKALAKAQQDALELLQLSAKPAGAARRARLAALQADPLVQFVAARFAGQRPLPRLQALEHRPRRQHDARGRQPHGRLRRHRGLPGIPRPEVDGRPARSHLRRPGSRAAPASSPSP